MTCVRRRDNDLRPKDRGGIRARFGARNGCRVIKLVPWTDEETDA